VRKLLKNRAFAILLSAVIIAVSLYGGINRSVTREINRVEALFYRGVPDTAQGYTKPSIESQINQYAGKALGLISVANNYPETELWRNRLRDARDAWIGYGGGFNSAFTDITSRTVSAGRMRETFEELYAVLIMQNLSEQELRTVSDCAQGFRGAAAYADELGAEYNEHVFALQDIVIGGAKLMYRVGTLQYVSKTTTTWDDDSLGFTTTVEWRR
jgi:hypothetical protein